MLVRGAFNHLLRPGLRRDFRDEYDSHEEQYPAFLSVGSQDRAEVEATAIAGLPQMVQRGEVEPVTFMDPAMSDKLTFIDDEYALGFSISKRMMEDDLYSKANQNSKWLARSARLTQEYRAAALLDDAFSGSVFTGLEGEALCSTSHSLLNGTGTWSNQLAANTQLSVTGMQAMLDLADNLVDHNGDPIPSMPTRLIINVADRWKAIQITQSEFEPFTSDNQINAIRKGTQSLDFRVNNYKTQGKDWFMIDPDLNDAHFLFRVRPEFDDDFDFRTKAALFTARQRINVYFFDQRGWFGSNAT